MQRALGSSLICLLVLAIPCHAYLDPGSGSMFVQLLLGGAAGLAVMVKLYWRQITSLLGKKPPQG